MRELLRPSLGIVLVGFALNFPWEILQMPYYAGPPQSLATTLGSHIGPALVDALIVLAIWAAGAVLFSGPHWNPGWDLRRWAFLLGAGAAVATGIEWRALYVSGAWAYAAGMLRIPGLGVGLLPVLQMILLPAATIATVAAARERWEAGRRRAPSYRAILLAVGVGVMGILPPAEAAALEVPPSLSGLRLHTILRAEEARREVDRLHGMGISLADAISAQYRGGGWDIALYMAETSDDSAARAHIEEMTARIHSGHGRLIPPRGRTQDGVVVSAVIGRGRVHHAFRRGSRVICVTVDGALARRALADAIHYYR